MHYIRLGSLCCFSALLVLTSSVSAAERAFEFSGVVGLGNDAVPGSTTFGETINTGTLVSGRFVYESNSSATHFPGGCVDCTGYEQNHINGFWADFGGVEVQADSYVIEVSNDVDNMGAINDVVTVRFSSDLTPVLPEPILVNGTPFTTGIFSLSFFADSSYTTDSSLPSDLDPNDFIFLALASTLSDSTTIIDVLFTLTSLTSISVDSADHDLDDEVDGADFMVWQRNQGGSGQNGDTNSDGIVNGADLATWQSQYGNQTVLINQSIPIPEPSGLVIFSGIMLQFLGAARRLRN